MTPMMAMPENNQTSQRDRELLDSAVKTTVQLDRAVRRLNKDLSSVHKASHLLTGPMDLRQVLEIVVRTVAEALGMDAAGLRLLDQESGMLKLEATFGLSESYTRKGPVTAGESKLNIRALRGEPIVIDDMQTSSFFKKYRKDIVREGLVGCMTIGLIYKGAGIGMLRLYSKRKRDYSPQDIALAQTIASQSAAAIINARLYAEALEKQRMERQLKLAGAVQRHLIPRKPPQVPGLDIAAIYVPCYEVGGDLYDFYTYPDGRLLIVIGDVMGKGMPASLAMASVRSSLRAYAESTGDLPTLMARVNRALYHDTAGDEFTTMICALIEPDRKSVAYCNAGHNPAIFIHGQEVTELHKGGPVLGIRQDSQYEMGCCSLQTDDMLLFFTDGLQESMNFERECFGRERIIQAAQASAEMTAEAAARNILWLMRKFTGLTKRFDDTALVVLKKTPIG